MNTLFNPRGGFQRELDNYEKVGSYFPPTNKMLLYNLFLKISADILLPAHGSICSILFPLGWYFCCLILVVSPAHPTPLGEY